MIAAVERAEKRGRLAAGDVRWAAEFWASDLDSLFEGALLGRLPELRGRARELLVVAASRGSPAVRRETLGRARAVTGAVAAEILEAATFDAPPALQEAIIAFVRSWRLDDDALARVMERAPRAAQTRSRRRRTERRRVLRAALVDHEGTADWTRDHRLALVQELKANGIAVGTADPLRARPRKGSGGLASVARA